MRIEEKEYTKSIDISIWKKVFPFLAPRKNVLIMVIVMNILCSVVDIIMPLFQRQAIDSFIEKNTLAGLGGFIALYIAVIVFQMWSVICFTRGCMTLDVETGRDMKRALFVHLQKLSFSYYNATPVGYILSRVMNDVARITELIAWDVIVAVGYLLCSGCVCCNAVSELETGFGDHADRSSYCSPYLVFPE